MKKYALILVAAVFVFGILGFRASSANAETVYVPEGCQSGFAYSPITGEPCGTTTNVGCLSGYLFSPITGKPCSEQPRVNEVFYRDLTIGSKGEDVKLLQRILKDQAYYLGALDGSYGPRTGRAVRDFQEDSNLSVNGVVSGETRRVFNNMAVYYTTTVTPSSVVISGVSGPQSLRVNEQGTWTVSAYDKYGGNLSYSVVWGDEDIYPYAGANSLRSPYSQQSATFTHKYLQSGFFPTTFTVTNQSGQSESVSLSVNVGNGTPGSSITVFSPNGGETWAKGTTQMIKWQEATIPFCENCGAPTPKTYNISLVPYYPPCTTNVCPMYAYRAPYTIANTQGSSYNWQAGRTWEGDMVPDGQYTIQVCQTGTSVCDSSDSSFRLVTGTTTTVNNRSPEINGLAAVPTSVRAGQEINFSWAATDADNDNLFWSINWGDGTPMMAYDCPLQARQNGQNKNFSASHAWQNPGEYRPVVTVADCRGGTNTHNFTVAVKVAASPKLVLVSPAEGEELNVGANYEISWDSTSAPSYAKLDLYLARYDGGLAATLVKNLGPIGGGRQSWTWTVPNMPGTYWLVGRLHDGTAGTATMEGVITDDLNLIYITIPVRSN